MSKLILLLNRITLFSYTRIDCGGLSNWGVLKDKIMTNLNQKSEPDDDCLVNENVRLPYLLDILRILEEDIALVGRLRSKSRQWAGILRQGLQISGCLVVHDPLVFPEQPGD